MSELIGRDDTAVRIYFSHSHHLDDSMIVFKLEKYLSKRFRYVKRRTDPRTYEMAINFWCDRRVTTGSGWHDELNESEFQEANYILLALSPDYLDSDYCRTQMYRASKREQFGSAKVIPVLLCPVEWQPPAHWQLLPSNGQPVTAWADREEAFADIAEGLLRAIPAEIQSQWIDMPEGSAAYFQKQFTEGST